MTGGMRPHGFTMVELVIAIAIATVIVVAVHSATICATGVAERQKAARMAEMELDRFLAVLTRDCRGWVQVPSDSVLKPPATSDERILLQFRTLADGMEAASGGSGSAFQPRSVFVRYICRSMDRTHQIVRCETTSGSQGVDLRLLVLTEPPRFEYYEQRKWTEAPPGFRPTLMRLCVGDRTLLVMKL